MTTFGGSERALEVANALVAEQLAACVNVLGEVRSVYRWNGDVTHETEVLCVIKTTAEASGFNGLNNPSGDRSNAHSMGAGKAVTAQSGRPPWSSLKRRNASVKSEPSMRARALVWFGKERAARLRTWASRSQPASVSSG